MTIGDESRPAGISSPSTAAALGELVASLSSDEFASQHWGCRPWYGRWNHPGAAVILNSLGDLDHLLTLTSTGRAEGVTAFKADGSKLLSYDFTPRYVPSIYEMYDAYHKGYSLIIEAMELRSASALQLCNAVKSALDHHASINLYVTPPRARAFNAHVDDHDSLVVQVRGTKTWRLAEELGSDADLDLSFTSKTLVPGDVVYLPRGLKHAACTEAQSSLHLTIGIPAFTWLDYLTSFVAAAADADQRLRDPLPPRFIRSVDSGFGLASTLLTDLIADPATHQAALRRLQNRLRRNFQPAPDGHFSSLDAVVDLGVDSVVALRSVQRPTISDGVGGIVVAFDGNCLHIPGVTFAPAMRFVAATPRFRVSDLPDNLVDSAKIALVRDLVVGGLLRICAET